MNPALASALFSTSSRLRTRSIGWIQSLLLACLLTLVRPATTAADSAGRAVGAPASQISLRQGMGWEDWNTVRDQHSPRARIKVFVPKGEAPDAAKVRVVLLQTPKPSSGSPQAVLDTEVASAKRQCKKVTARTLRKGDADRGPWREQLFKVVRELVEEKLKVANPRYLEADLAARVSAQARDK